MLIAENLSRYYGSPSLPVKALDDVSFKIATGEYVGIIGTSGSGKSTLLHMLGGLDEPSAGHIWIDDVDLYQLTEQERTIFRRRHIGFVFQSYNLLPTMNVYENIILPVGLDGEKVRPERVRMLLSFLDMEAHMKKMPYQLSGGQQQRVAIARALINSPSLILADEPTGNLDSASSALVVQLLKSIHETFGHTILLITHDDEIAQGCERILRLSDGKLVKS